MLDKNGVEIKTGDVVRISGAYFKNDNGLYFVDSSPGDPNWCGSDYSLKKVLKNGKISRAKHSICFWPIGIFVNDLYKRAAANEWNAENAKIEVIHGFDKSEIAAHFENKAEQILDAIKRDVWDFGEDSEIVKKDTAIYDHYIAVAEKIA